MASSILPKMLELCQATRKHESFEKLFEKSKKGAKSPQRKKQCHDKSSLPRIFGIDCEMILTSFTDEDSCHFCAAENCQINHVLEQYSLARASLVELVDEEMIVRFDLYVQPPSKHVVLDRLEHVSGISEEHLKNAQHTLEDVKDLLDEYVSEKDIIIGHSLSNDFEALEWFHPNIIDTSLFFSIEGAPRITLGLKDVINLAFEETVQGSGAHDPILDAKYALRIAQFLVKNKTDPFVKLKEVPDRFKKLISFYGFDVKEEEEKAVISALNKIAEKYGASVSKPLRTVTNEKGFRNGTVTFQFDNPNDVLKAFEAFPAEERRNGPTGFVDQSGFRKKCVVFKVEDVTLAGEVSTYHRAELKFKKEYVCDRNKVGLIVGKKGVQIMEIQRKSGARVTNAPKDAKSVVFTIQADSEEKVSKALQLIKDESNNKSAQRGNAGNRT